MPRTKKTDNVCPPTALAVVEGEMDGMKKELVETLNEYERHVDDQFSERDETISMVRKSTDEVRAEVRSMRTQLREVEENIKEEMLEALERESDHHNRARASIIERMVTHERLEEIRREILAQVDDLRFVCEESGRNLGLRMDHMNSDHVIDMERMNQHMDEIDGKFLDMDAGIHKDLAEVKDMTLTCRQTTLQLEEQMDVVEDDMYTTRTDVHRESGWSILLAAVSTGICVAVMALALAGVI